MEVLLLERNRDSPAASVSTVGDGIDMMRDRGGGEREREREGERKRERKRGRERVQYLKVNTLALVRNDKVRVHWTLWSPLLCSAALAGQSIALQSRLDREVRDNSSTRLALQCEVSGLGPQPRGLDDDPRHLHQPSHVLRLEGGGRR